MKAGVISELEKLGDSIDLKPLIREYVTGLAEVHRWLRELIRPDIARWDRSVADVLGEFEAAHGGGSVAVALVVLEEAETPIEPVWLSTEAPERRKELEQKNGQLLNYGRHYVSGEVVKDKN
jgi:hypothetical protein